MGIKINILGSPEIIDANGDKQTVRGHKSWALLARVLLARQPLSRRDIATELFPEVDDPLGSLRWCLASLRKALNVPGVFSGDPIESNLPKDAEVDVLNLEKGAFRTDGIGNLLEGIEPQCSAEFSTWLLIEREQVAGAINAGIRQKVLQGMSLGDYDQAIQFAEIGVRRAPFDEAPHILLVKSLSLAGQHDAALQHVVATEASFIEELGEKPSDALRSAARRTIAAPPAGISPRAVINSLIESGLAALAAGAADAGVDNLRRAVAEAEKAADDQLLAKASFELGNALVRAIRGYDDEGAIVLRQSIELARRCGSADIASTGLRELGYVDTLAGRRPDAAANFAEAISLTDDPEILATIHVTTGINLVDWGKTDDGMNHIGTSLEYSRGIQNQQIESWALGFGGWALLQTPDSQDEANKWFSDSLKLVSDINWIAFRPWPLAGLCESRVLQQDDPKVILPDLEDAFALSCHLGDPCWEAAVARSMGLSYAAMNDNERAMEWLIEAKKRCLGVTDTWIALVVEILASMVDLSLKMDQPIQADTLAREYLSLAARVHMDTHVSRAVKLLN